MIALSEIMEQLMYTGQTVKKRFLITQVIKWYLIHLMTEHKVFQIN